MCMQSGGGAQQVHGRSPASAASPSSSSSAASHLGFHPMQHQLQHQQLLAPRKSLQQQLLRKPEGNEAFLAGYQGAPPGFMSSNNFASSSQPIQQSRKGLDLVQNHAYSQIQDNQAQFQQYALQAAHFKSSLPSGKEQGNPKTQEPRSFPAPNSSPQMGFGQAMAGNMGRQNFQIMPGSQMAVAAQYQAMQAWALERNIDLSLPANAGLMAQLLPIMQSRMASQQKSIDSSANGQPIVTSENSPCGNSSSDASGGPTVSGKARLVVPPSPFGSTPQPVVLNSTGNNPLPHQFGSHSGENQLMTQRMPSMPPPQSSVNMGHTASAGGHEMQHPKLNQLSPQANDGNLGNQLPSQQHFGFTKQQLYVLKAQILAFRRIKKGDGTLPEELLSAIAPPPLESQLHLENIPAGTGATNSDRRNMESNSKQVDGTEKDPQTLPSVHIQNEPVLRESISTVMTEKEPVIYARKEEQQACALAVNSEVESTTSRNDIEKGKAIAHQETISMSDGEQLKKPVQVGNESQAPKDGGSTRKYHGPLFDFPVFTRKHDSFGGSTMGVNNCNGNNLVLAYDVKDLLFEEGMEVFQRKRTENMKKIGGLLAVNLERKRISPDVVLRLQIEEKKMRLLDLQAKLRDEIDQNQQEIMTMPDRLYRKFVRQCERQRAELARHVQVTQKAMREKQLKSIFLWRKKLLESHWAIRDSRTARNRGVAKYHERMLREFSKRKDDDRNKRMEALKNNDVQRYREMLMEQQTSIPGDTGERYAVLSSFLTQTEDYLQKLGGKITAAKSQQEVDEAANAAAIAARAQGLSEEEVRAAAACAREEVMIRNRFSEMNAPKDNSSVNKYYNLAHAVSERVMRQPSMLRAGTLRDYQLVGLQWMLSLYNNKLNGILADEMGLGKTVQVMALIAYLMEFKGNYGPHLIIVPNAVLVNWKSELHTWLPSVSCIYYVGGKDQRAKLFSQEVCALKFNVLVTTYEFIMYDRTKLSKIDWKYIVIDEAQRMKDRESVLARDLDRYRCQRRLLLTGTPLQNDLKELWSLLNLLLPEVFDNRKAFHDWFSQPFQKETHNAEDDWLETEKKVIIIHRLHQILEPFMLRRRVEDVEGSLPPKVSIVIKCRMSAIQSSIYDWIKTTGTIRVDPEDEQRRVQKNSNYQPKAYKPLNNRCMELRKTCNHPLLNYPYFFDFSKDFLVRSCGKLWILDRILVKLQRTGHRVLLFSTMTKLLDILEEYLQWRRLVYRRIDGTTSLEDRESAIVEFNSPDSECFIFLLSIRAAGRGLNLQSADTVVIYDPDPNPKNEEQAVARAHRIGQKREVKVIYLEAVVDKIASHQKEDEFRSGGTVDMENDDELAGKDRYMGSIESLIRNNIQQYKIDMADEVINAGRFDQRTTHEERRLTLETLLHDEDRFQEMLHDVPSLMEVNQMIARSEEEVEFFNQMDDEFDWAEDTLRYDEVPKWLRTSSKEVNATIASLSKKPLRNSLYISNIGTENHTENESPTKKRGRPKKFPNYAELYDDNEGFSDASSEEKIGDSVHEEEGETEEFEYEETGGAVETEWEAPMIKDLIEDDAPVCVSPPEAPENLRNNHILQQPGSSGSSSDTRRLTQVASPLSSQKFGSLSALDARPGSVSKRLPDDLEEGEIAASGDSHMDQQQSGSWIHDHDDGEDEQVLQPRIKRKRSIRLRPRQSLDKVEDKSSNEKPYFHRVNPSNFPFQLDNNKHESHQLRIDLEHKSLSSFVLPPSKLVKSEPSSLKNRRTLPARRSMTTLKSSRLISVSTSTDDATELTRESWDGKVGMTSCGTSNAGTKMSDVIQKKFKTVLSKLQRRIDKEGSQIVPLLTDLWKRGENYGYMGGPGAFVLDIRKIDQRVDRFEYSGVMGFVADVQNMLKSALQFFRFSNEVRTEARKVHDLFFDIMKIAFPESDFREARNPNFLSAPFGPSLRPAAITTQAKRHRLINEVEPVADPRARVHMPPKELRAGPMVHCNDDSALLMHPGELVICKKRRKEREKMAAAKVRSGPGLSGSDVRSGPGLAVARSGLIQHPISRGSQGWANPVQAGGSNVGWANPVKRMRTDGGRRRSSYL